MLWITFTCSSWDGGCSSDLSAMIKVKQVRHKSVEICRWSITHSVGFWDTHPTKSGVNWKRCHSIHMNLSQNGEYPKVAINHLIIRSPRNLGPMHWAAKQNQWLDLPLDPRKTGRPTASEAEPRHNIAANNCPLQKKQTFEIIIQMQDEKYTSFETTNGLLVIYRSYIQFEQAEFCTQLVVVKWQPCL